MLLAFPDMLFLWAWRCRKSETFQRTKVTHSRHWYQLLFWIHSTVDNLKVFITHTSPSTELPTLRANRALYQMSAPAQAPPCPKASWFVVLVEPNSGGLKATAVGALAQRMEHLKRVKRVLWAGKPSMPHDFFDFSSSLLFASLSLIYIYTYSIYHYIIIIIIIYPIYKYIRIWSYMYNYSISSNKIQPLNEGSALIPLQSCKPLTVTQRLLSACRGQPA